MYWVWFISMWFWFGVFLLNLIIGGDVVAPVGVQIACLAMFHIEVNKRES